MKFLNPLFDHLATIAGVESMEFGQLYTAGGAGTQTPNVTYALMSQWAADGASSSGVTPANASNKITVSLAGHYLVAFQISFAGSNSSIVDAQVFWDGNAQTQITVKRKLGASGLDVGSASAVGIIDVTSGNTDIDLRVKCDGAADVFDLKEGQLVVAKLADT